MNHNVELGNEAQIGITGFGHFRGRRAELCFGLLAMRVLANGRMPVEVVARNGGDQAGEELFYSSAYVFLHVPSRPRHAT